jgi:hypothetical protein
MDEKQKKIKRKRMDSASEQSRIMAGASRNITPPDNIDLTEEELVFFKRIIAEMAKAEWTEHQIDLVAFMARSMHSLNINQRKLRDEGGVIKGKNGEPIVSPRKKAVEDSIASIVSLRRSLSIHARAQGVNKADIGRRMAMAKEIEDSFFEDDLISRPIN